MADDAEQPRVSFEQALERLEGIVQRLEEGELGLDESLGQYEEGVRLLKRCYGLLDRAERRIELLSRVDQEGNAESREFDDREASLDEKAQARSQRRSGRKKSGISGKTEEEFPSRNVDEPPTLF